MTRSVLCPLDSFPGAERALPSAFDAAELCNASLTLFSAVEDPHMVAQREAYLQKLATQRRSTRVTPPSVEVVVDPHAPPALVARCSTPDVFAVMATSTQPLLHDGYLGSAAERVARDAYNPVLLVGPKNDTRLGDVARVVVPCDGSPESEFVLPVAKECADRLKVEMWVITVLSAENSANAANDADVEANYVRRLAKPFGAQWEVLHGRHPARTITEWAGPALIAMTTHGRSGLRRLALGSVTTGTARWAHGPVLVAHPKINEEQP